MTIGDMIKSTRLDHNMTQEEYGKKFGVTRQTVSSWENDKSIPDLQMLITICKTYKISLDAMLVDDPEYVEKIDKGQKIIAYLKRIVPIAIAVSCVLCLVFGTWSIKANIENKSFASRVTEEGFQLENGIYLKKNSKIQYEIPNQKLPFMKNKFYAQKLEAVYRNRNDAFDFLLNYEDGTYFFDINYGIDNMVDGTITGDGNVNYTKGINDLDKENIELWNEVLNQMVLYYNIAYDI